MKEYYGDKLCQKLLEAWILLIMKIKFHAKLFLEISRKNLQIILKEIFLLMEKRLLIFLVHVLVLEFFARLVLIFYLGWIEVDQQRYFDYRYTVPFKMYDHKSPLYSDFKYRPDYLTLKQGEKISILFKFSLKIGYVEKAQKEKETLEEIQRHDAKLRKAQAAATTTASTSKKKTQK